MDNHKKNYILMFLGGIAAALFILPILQALGVPSFNEVLVSLFGEDNPLALAFSLLLVVIVIFLMVRLIKKDG
ncbi:hypothetical protein [Alkalicoccus daliensis]|uniref:Uncharacterized protein n=1 Tax=Alkalicoccus daliensis TaxID=745820 RepID=A0A1H0CUT2_9BACI|nr:hypothetical protein [Alkalicoccus daliensis]SDN61642.1 hypothetical protein SAMN04488053_102239 [Alkalicoccus daliensis]